MQKRICGCCGSEYNTSKIKDIFNFILNIAIFLLLIFSILNMKINNFLLCYLLFTVSILTKGYRCPKCKNMFTMPLDTPQGKKIHKELNKKTTSK